MTIPRSISLQTFGDGIHLVQQPVNELKRLRGKHHHFEERTIDDDSDLLKSTDVNGNLLEVKAQFKLGNAKSFGLKVAQSEQEETVIGYNTEAAIMYVDRKKSGQIDFNEQFPGVHKAPLVASGEEVILHIFLDESSLEVFGNGGRTVLTDRIFPFQDSNGVSLFANDGSTELISLDVWQLNSAWNKSEDPNN